MSGFLSGASDITAAMGSSAAQGYFNKKEAKKNRAWQAKMSNTAHQREVADLEAAGLNPVLSVNGGAATGSGSAASITSPNMRNPVATALEYKLMEAQARKLNAEAGITENKGEVSDRKTGVFKKVFDYMYGPIRNSAGTVYNTLKDLGYHNGPAAIRDRMSKKGQFRKKVGVKNNATGKMVW